MTEIIIIINMTKTALFLNSGPQQQFKSKSAANWKQLLASGKRGCHVLTSVMQ